MSRFRILVILVFSLIVIPAFPFYTGHYYTGHWEVTASSVNMLDYPDKRASSIMKLPKGTILNTIYSGGPESSNHAMLSSGEKQGFWVLAQTPDGVIGYVNRDKSKLREIDSDLKELCLDISKEDQKALFLKGYNKYVNQAKTQLKYLGFGLIALVILGIIWYITDKIFFGILAYLIYFSLFCGFIYYFYNNPHSMWFVSPTINGYGYSFLCIFPTFILFNVSSMKIIRRVSIDYHKCVLNLS